MLSETKGEKYLKTSSYERILTPIFREVKFSLGLMEWEEYSQTRSGCEQGTPNSRTILEPEKKKKKIHVVRMNGILAF